MTRRRKLAFGAVFAALQLSATAIAVAQEHADPHAAQPAAPAAHAPAAEPETTPETAGTHPGAGPLTPAGPGHEHEGPGHTGPQDKVHPDAHGGAHHGPPPINWTDLGDKHRPAFIALVVNFGLLVGLYYTLGKKPVTEALKQRRTTIGKDIDDAQKMLAEAKERAKKYQGDLKNVDTDAETAKAALVAAGRGETDRLLSEADEKAERMKRDAERLVEQERKQMRQDLLLETIELAVAEASKVLERSVTPEDHARLAQDLLAELSRAPGAQTSSRPMGGAS